MALSIIAKPIHPLTDAFYANVLTEPCTDAASTVDDPFYNTFAWMKADDGNAI